MERNRRTKFVGASDLADVFSLPPYGCIKRLQLKKTSVPTDYPEVENEHIRRGKFYEPIALKEYKKQTGYKLMKAPVLRHIEYPFMIAHPDALAEGKEYREKNFPVEVKCPTRRNFEKMKHEGLAEAYILQIQYQIALAKVSFGVSVNFCPETTELLPFNIYVDKDLIEMIFARVIEFWEKRVKGGEEARRLEPTDRRCQTCLWRKTCQGEAILKAIKNDVDQEGLGLPEIVEMETDLTLTPLAEEYKQARAIMAEAEEYLEDVAGRVRQAMGDRVAVETLGNRIYYKSVESWRWDTKALSMAHPELENQFKRKSVTRPLRIYSC